MNEIKEEIRDRLSIEDVVGEYLELRRAGRNFKALSPFSNEKTPSFVVSPDKRIWHDFSSGRGGDIFSFIMEMEGVEFKEALKILARKAGVELKMHDSKEQQALAKRKQRELDLHKLVTRFFQIMLVKNQKALDYAVKDRGLNQSTIELFKIGYAPNHSRAMVDFLLKHNYKISEIEAAGLSNRFKTDLFRSRLMIPLLDVMGQTIGFTGRGLEKDAIPKYLNTPSTLLYNKSRHIFGLSQAKEAIRKLDQVVIVEGNMDVISSHQAGISQVVATAGTAITADHLKLIGRYTGDVRLAFDADQAGINAAERAIELAQQVGIDLKIISFPEEFKDPDEIIQHSVKLWQESIDQATSAIDWLIKICKNKYDFKTAVGKRDYSLNILRTIAKINDPVEQSDYIQKVADVLGVEQASVLSQFQALTTNKSIKKPRLDKKSLSNQEQVQFRYQDSLLALGLISVEARVAISKLDKNLFQDFFEKPRQALVDFLQQHQQDFSIEALQSLQELSIYAKVLELEAEERYVSWSKNDIMNEIKQLIRKIKISFIKKTTDNLTEQLRQAEFDNDEKLSNQLRVQLNQIIKGAK